MGFIIALLTGTCVGCFAGGIGIITLRRASLQKLKGAKKLSLLNKIRDTSGQIKQKLLQANCRIAGAKRYSRIAVVIDKLDMSGKMTVPQLILAEEASVACGVLLLWLLTGSLFAGACGGAAAYFIPAFVLGSKLKKRQSEILKELPDALDIICANIEGGLSLNRSVFRYAEKNKGLLAEEFSTAAKKTQLGKSFSEAVREMDERLDIKDLSASLGAFVHAERSGGNLKDIIKAQAEEVRKKRFQNLKQKAHEAPVKLLFPLMAFIFPVIFIVLFGPIIIKLMAGF
jgi:Flp pilus assembly protein TadB